MPTRPNQNDPKRVAAWQRRRRAVGMRIQSLRLDQGLTQEQLALRSGVSRNVLMDVEHGRRGILHERLFDVAKVLGVSVSELLEGIR
ncbi:helix-turn-helix transcriptional regulator [Mycobacterium sp. 29Ha]|uniref:helix-turn-helix domain-containing protein n=1 Tax=Mycobacterium sp. 29Ha TaxID=2939268 RepID=UPI00293936B0|nr:helix-turn-helix transcriptional regulator [Mycobacterium sp. 29Ha]MDV3134418.1 helix-turn-helix domain-containing protein [Mycobacterium sp. 29Ha]